MANIVNNQNLPFLLQYAGVPFVLDTAKVVRMSLERPERSSETSPIRQQQPEVDLIDELNRLLPTEYLQDFSMPSNYPGRNLGALAMMPQVDPQPNPAIRINDWYYPFGAGRFSIFRGLATSSMAAAMLQTTQGRYSAPFVMQQSPISPNNPQNNVSQYTVTTNMFMLPPRPLAEQGQRYGVKLDGLYLITLVDDRYYFQGTPCTLRVHQNTQWSDLLNDLANALGITLFVPKIPTVYGQPEPDSQLWANMESAPALLDAVAYNIGSQVVRNYDGTYSLQTPLQSQAIINANRGIATQVVRVAGGDIFTSGENLPVGNLNAARNAVVPQEISVTFPKYVYGNDPVPHFVNTRYQNQRPSAQYEESYGDVFTQAVPISSGGPVVSGLIGTSTQFLHTTAKALYRTEAAAVSGAATISGTGFPVVPGHNFLYSGDGPINYSGLNALAMQLAQDRYNAQVASALDEVYPGIFAWTPEGIHDIVFTYSAKSRLAATRVMRTEWNLAPVEFQHSTPLTLTNITDTLNIATDTPVGVGGPSVAQTWRDSFATLELPIPSTALTQTLASGGYIANLAGIAFLPTQNRWRGIIDNEVILFEGTFNSTAVGIAARGIDGSIQIDHANGALLNPVIPDAGYGINLLTFEKNQWLYPSDMTSGGIQGINVIPQTQTVRVWSCIGQLINGVLHYSGAVALYELVSPSIAGEFIARENILIVDRNSKPLVSGKYYTGTFAGHSNAAVGNVASGLMSGTVAPVYLVTEDDVYVWALLQDRQASFNGGAYAWQQQSPVGGGSWIGTPGGIQGTWSGDPGYEANMQPTIKGTRVQMWMTNVVAPNGQSLEWRFIQACPASGGGI